MAVEVIAWVDPDGVETVLSDQPYTQVPIGSSGRFMPPISFVADEIPGQPGSRLREVRTLTREYELPLVIKGDDPMGLRAKIRELVGAFDPTRGAGKIRCTAHDGTLRELTCRYQSGLELEEKPGVRSPTFQKTILVLKAFDPYWYVQNPLTNLWAFSGSGPATWFPLFPLVLGASEVLAQPTVNNPGDVFTWPKWTITGPMTGVTLRNVTTEAALTLTTTLTAGEAVRIDTSPGIKSALRSPANLNVFSSLSALSELWPLERGNNVLSIEIAGAATGTEVTLEFTPRYLVP